MNMNIPSRCDFLQTRGGIRADFRGMLTTERGKGITTRRRYKLRVEVERESDRGSGGGRHVYIIVVARAGMAHRSPIFGDGNEGDASLALGDSKSGGLWVL